MARDYEQMSDSRFWEIAEHRLGVKYDGAILKTQETKNDEDPWEAGIYREGEERPVVKANATSEEGAKEQLFKDLSEERVRDAFKVVLDTLDYKERDKVERYAVLLLEVNHSVFTGSWGRGADDIANDIIRREYRERVQREVREIKDLIRDGDIKSDDDLYEHLREIGVTWNSDALDILKHSDNDEAYWDQMGGKPPGWSALATYAIQQDVQDSLGFNPSDITQVDCARCGEVTATEDDPTDCPKCGLDLSTSENEGVILNEEGDLVHVCENCEVEEDPDGKPIGPGIEFDCARCDNHCITPPAKAVERHGVELKEIDETLSVCVTCQLEEDTVDHDIPARTKFTCIRCGCAFTTPAQN